MTKLECLKNLSIFDTRALLVTALIFCAAPLNATEFPLPITEEDFRSYAPERAKLGQLLFYDKLLSGNRNIACATCHVAELGTSDGLSLGVGEGGIGLGPERIIPEGVGQPLKRVPRNSPALFNLGHKSITVLFHDGRVSNEDTYNVGFNTPVEEWLPTGLQSILAAQALMPLTSKVEMAGSREENEVAAAANRRIDQAWPAIVDRIRDIPEYVDLFRAAFPNIESQADISIVDVANALDDFQNSEWRSYTSPFDAYLNKEKSALNTSQLKGMELFFGKAKCAECHTGPLLTDQSFHALGIPPVGPGRTRKFDPYARDVGRMGETDALDDAYRFRTPSLRNVALTGPWGHDGAYGTLYGIVKHHADPKKALANWDPDQLILPPNAMISKFDLIIWEDQREMSRLATKLDVQPVDLTRQEISLLVAFLEALTDEKDQIGRLGKPLIVPSGLPID